MTHFRTSILPTQSLHQLGIKMPVLTLGSCFADAMGSRLKAYKISTLANPFGVVYNPHSIHKLLKLAVYNALIPESTFVQNREVFLNYDFHSEFSFLTQSALKTQLQAIVESTHNFLKSTQWLIITYGTTWVYQRNDTGEIVANCHKLPAKQFTKSLLTQNKIIESFEEMHQQLKVFNPEIKIILTVSPVRHIKDTLELNSVSKSILRLACHTLSTSIKDIMYFPAYEIMMDDLRDYRFYKADMLRPQMKPRIIYGKSL